VIEALSQKVIIKKPRQTTTVHKKEKRSKALTEKCRRRSKPVKTAKKVKAISVKPISKKI
jgi:hypothetical protein